MFRRLACTLWREQLVSYYNPPNLGSLQIILKLNCSIKYQTNAPFPKQCFSNLLLVISYMFLMRYQLIKFIFVRNMLCKNISWFWYPHVTEEHIHITRGLPSYRVPSWCVRCVRTQSVARPQLAGNCSNTRDWLGLRSTLCKTASFALT